MLILGKYEHIETLVHALIPKTLKRDTRIEEKKPKIKDFLS